MQDEGIQCRYGSVYYRPGSRAVLFEKSVFKNRYLNALWEEVLWEKSILDRRD